ncbi:hypothetical protein KOR34_03380 [Posidoniimonas corsicana]|uniref:Heparinase II/III-like protein n=2 Tax=Posidoniimonas corsicana TaxID=1938618 RepID=A0A5C5VBU8_9BACT|nr:hypothetical protein KOR34_03380 [Posidoniimonas corsicana]
MGRLALRREVEEANAYLQKATPLGSVGSTWALHEKGDYDFTLAALIPILFLFGDDPTLLYPKTVEHLLGVLLTEDGGSPLLSVPNTLGIVLDTENHLLMTEGSRYLKNRWLCLHGSSDADHDNKANGLEQWLLRHLAKLGEAGFYEFNSIPYEGYTLTALLNLEAFGSPAVRAAARKLLDRLNWEYAVASLGLRQFPPFRRQRRHAGSTDLAGDYHTALMKSWVSLSPDAPTQLRVRAGGLHHALWACWSPYRLPDTTAHWVLDKPRDYLVRIGHGPASSPEIYSGGPGYLLSAGGVGRGESSLVVARPTTLLLDDNASQLSEVIHLAGPGKDFDTWNNTGVWRRFAVAAGRVRTPTGWTPDAADAAWSVYQRSDRLCISVYSAEDLGLMHLSDSSNPHAVLTAIATANPDRERLRSEFTSPDGTRIRYDLYAPRDRWVILQVDGRSASRSFDQWPLMEEL